MPKVTFTNKVDLRTTAVLPINKVVAADMNEVKAGINALYDMFASLKWAKPIKLTSASFSGGQYTNATDLATLTADTDFWLFSDEGAGTLLKAGALAAGAGYEFNSTLGRITCPPGNYRLLVFKSVTVL